MAEPPEPRGAAGWVGAVEDGEGSAEKDRDSSHGNLFHAETRRRREKIAEKKDRKILRDLLLGVSAPPRERPFDPRVFAATAATLPSRSFAVLHRSRHPSAPAVPAAQDD